MLDFVLVCVLKPTTPNPRHNVVFKDTGNPRAFSPKRYVEDIYFACFLQGNPEQCQGDQLMACQVACKYNLKTTVWAAKLFWEHCHTLDWLLLGIYCI
jgi:hypothetical protein